MSPWPVRACSAISTTDGTLDEFVARADFPAPGTPIDCAVSGGPDSSALLALAVRAGCLVTAHHVDHGLRDGSADEAGVVRDMAARLGAAFVGHRVGVALGPNLEARARAARFAVLPAAVATGHTADDQAETVIVNFLRGAGVDGLAGMTPGPRHPILRLRRADTEAVCAHLGLRTVADPSNASSEPVRNRIRHEVLPLLAAIARRDPVPILARQADLLRSDAEYLEVAAASVDPADARALRAAPPALARRAVRRWLRPALGGYPPDGHAVERVLAVARGEVRAAEIAGGVRVSRRDGRLAIHGQAGSGPGASGH